MPKVVGFVELSSCFLVNVARKKVLDRPFRDAERGAEWKQWDKETAKRCTNVVVRISRCVVYPELRGVGVAGILAEAAKAFANERWHIGGWRPSFMEITAEMLRYWPFVEKAGFMKVGDTEGNADRIEKTMAYLLDRRANGKYPEKGGGILAMHKAHAETLHSFTEKQKVSTDEAIQRIKDSPENLSAKDWVALHGLYRKAQACIYAGGDRGSGEASSGLEGRKGGHCRSRITERP